LSWKEVNVGKRFFERVCRSSQKESDLGFLGDGRKVSRPSRAIDDEGRKDQQCSSTLILFTKSTKGKRHRVLVGVP